MKTVVVILLVLFVGGAAFGEAGGEAIGFTYAFSSQNYARGSGTPQNITLSAIGVNATFLSTAPFGAFGDVTLGWVVSGSVDGAALDMNAYNMKLWMDITMGVGYRFTLTPGLFLTFGLGPRVYSTLIFSDSSSNSINNAYVAGVSGTVKVEYMLSKNFGLSLSGKGAYDFLALLEGLGTTFKNGFALSAAAGVSIHL